MQTSGFLMLVRMMERVRRYWAVWLLAAVLPLAGCGGSSSTTTGGGGGTNPPPPSGTALQGSVHAGQMAVSGASVQMYAAGSSGYGSAATSVLSSAGTTDASGNFTVYFTCTAASQLVYVVATGGNPGLASGTNNTSLALMAALGPCGNLTSSSTVSVNEITTVASVWPLAQFMSAGAGANLGTSSGNGQGLTNAFSKVNNLVNVASGAMPGPALPTGAAAPTSELNTLADILNTCTGSNGNTGECSQLFSAATPSGGTAPANTIDAALDTALNPLLTASALYGLLTSPSSAPFQPGLTAAPNDWTVAINYTGGGLSAPSALAIDQNGNVWVADYNSALSEFSPQGQAISPAAGFTGGGLRESYGLAIDNSGNVWVTDEESTVNSGRGSMTEFSSSSQLLSGANGFFGGGINFPVAAASDTMGNIWVVNYGNSTVSVLANSGTAVSGAAGYGGGQLDFPVAIALDANQNAWVANQSSTTVTSISADGTQVNQITCCNGPSGLAIDGHGNVWAANYFGDSVSELSNTGTVLSTGYTGGGILRPQGIAVDGQGNIWVANYHGDSISVLQGADGATPGTPLSPASGLGQAAGLSLPFALAVDGSGSVWVSNNYTNTVTEFVGAATPVKTPLLGPVQKP
jgi:streptogramin lyase